MRNVKKFINEGKSYLYWAERNGTPREDALNNFNAWLPGGHRWRQFYDCPEWKSQINLDIRKGNNKRVTYGLFFEDLIKAIEESNLSVDKIQNMRIKDPWFQSEENLSNQILIYAHMRRRGYIVSLCS